MVNYGLKDRVALITGTNNPQGIGATTAFAFAREGAKLVLVYKKVLRPFDKSKTDRNGADRYYEANAGSADAVERKLRAMGADCLVLESDIADEAAVKEIFAAAIALCAAEFTPESSSNTSQPHFLASTAMLNPG